MARGREGRSIGARQRAGAALTESEVVGAAGDGARDVDEIGGGAEIRRLKFGLGAQWSSRDARARAADIEAACRRRVRSVRRSSTAGVGGGTSLRAREESKHIVALFFRHLFSRVRAQGEFGRFGQVALRTGRRERGTTGEDYVE